MREDLLKSIKGKYEKKSAMISTGKDKESGLTVSEDMDVTETILGQTITEELLKEENIGSTNGILMYISELEYATYKLLFGKELNKKEKNPKAIYVLYMDIENNKKYFIKKSKSEDFEKKHNVVRLGKNGVVNDGWNHTRNMKGVAEVRQEFIGTAMYEGQEEGVKQIVKKYGEVNKEGEK